MIKATVPQTNTSGRVEYTQANEITKLKELGNIAPVTSGQGLPTFGGPQRKMPCNCLSKTQVGANSQEDVYRLTPAQCQKVKWRRSRAEMKPW